MVGFLKRAGISAALLVAVLLLVIFSFSFLRFSDSEARINSIESELQQSKVTQLFFDTFSGEEGFCDSFLPVLESVSNSTFELGYRIEDLEKAEAFSDESIVLKNQYMLQEIELWLYVLNVKKNCIDSNFHTLLFFYTNRLGGCLDCKAQGFVLDDLKEKYGDKLWIFSFETNYDLGLVETMQKQFGVEQLPTIILDEEESFTGFNEFNKLDSVLQKLIAG